MVVSPDFPRLPSLACGAHCAEAKAAGGESVSHLPLKDQAF
jgi:hypothetical protein